MTKVYPNFLKLHGYCEYTHVKKTEKLVSSYFGAELYLKMILKEELAHVFFP